MLAWGGGVFALLVAVALFTRFSIDGNLWRDESIYAYGGQQLLKGVPMYVSIFDPKTPLASILTALGAGVGGWFGLLDVHGMRLEFFVFACMTVVAVYLLALQLWKSPLAAIASAATFVSFKGFARDALEGPDAKTPGILLAVVSMTLMVRRQWFWGAFVGSLAFLVWQPLGVYAFAAVVGAVLTSEAAERWRAGARALAGAVIPVAATTLYFLIAGALPQFIQAAVTFPVTGVKRGHDTVFERIGHIAHVVSVYYVHARLLFWGGLLLLVVLLIVWLRNAIVLGTLLALVAFTLTDFQGYPDLYPMLPYAALGIGAAVAFAEQRLDGTRLRPAVTAVGLIALAIGLALSWSVYSSHRSRSAPLPAERADARMLNEILGPGGTLYSLGDPTPLVLTERRNPSRFIYLGTGVDEWIVHRTPGGLAGWEARIQSADPDVVVMSTWASHTSDKVRAWLAATYGRGTYLGNWLLFMNPAARARYRGLAKPSTSLRPGSASGFGTPSRPPIRFAHMRTGTRRAAARSDG
jgi:hypothetical protein